jgi:hypothetical protein
VLRQDDNKTVLRDWMGVVNVEGGAPAGSPPGWRSSREADVSSTPAEAAAGVNARSSEPEVFGRRLLAVEEVPLAGPYGGSGGSGRSGVQYRCLWQVDAEVFSYQERTLEARRPPLEPATPNRTGRRAETSGSPKARTAGAAPAGDSVGTYTVLSPAAVTRELTVDAATVTIKHTYRQGEAIEVLELREDHGGKLRARTARGWVSVVASRGERLLQRQQPTGAASNQRSSGRGVRHTQDGSTHSWRSEERRRTLAVERGTERERFRSTETSLAASMIQAAWRRKKSTSTIRRLLRTLDSHATTAGSACHLLLLLPLTMTLL